jgi:NADPH:quinone reductase-like Zn-dependent oxidoreductase
VLLLLLVAAGVDVVFDPVGGQALFESLKCAAAAGAAAAAADA